MLDGEHADLAHKSVFPNPGLGVIRNTTCLVGLPIQTHLIKLISMLSVTVETRASDKGDTQSADC